MPRPEFECPLCGHISTTRTTPGNVYVQCQNCGWYRLTYLAHSYYFDESGSRRLNDVTRKRLIDYVKAGSAANSSAPVEISLDVLKRFLWIQESA